jgi:hypothetical protein
VKVFPVLTLVLAVAAMVAVVVGAAVETRHVQTDSNRLRPNPAFNTDLRVAARLSAG